MLTRTIRERLVEIERLGLTVIDTRSRHWKVRIAAPDGRTMLIVVALLRATGAPHTKFQGATATLCAAGGGARDG